MNNSPAITASKTVLCAALRAFIGQRSGIDARDYDTRESLMSDYRPMLRRGKQAKQMLSFIEGRDSITAQDLIHASNRAYSGRLQFVSRDDGKVAVDYTPGQYFVTEYRAAACAVLANVLWSYFGNEGKTSAENIRKAVKGYFGRGIAREWFN